MDRAQGGGLECTLTPPGGVGGGGWSELESGPPSSHLICRWFVTEMGPVRSIPSVLIGRGGGGGRILNQHPPSKKSNRMNQCGTLSVSLWINLQSQTDTNQQSDHYPVAVSVPRSGQKKKLRAELTRLAAPPPPKKR